MVEVGSDGAAIIPPYHRILSIYAAIDDRFSHANMVAHLKAIIEEDEHCLIASKREKRHPKLYCAEWHKLLLVYVGPETVSREAFIEAYRT